MSFIIEQQAKFSTDMEKLKERMDQLAENLKRTNAIVTGNISRLTDALLSLTNIVERHDEQITALAEQGKETGSRLNALIEIVERPASGHK